MALFKLFTPKAFDAFEKKGDRLLKSNDLGLARLEYEKALSRIEKADPTDASEHRRRIGQKILEVNETLAGQHKENAENLVDIGDVDEARELLELAAELTDNPDLSAEIDRLLTEVKTHKASRPDSMEAGMEIDPDDPDSYFDDDYFFVLCNALPEDVAEAYLNYGDAFESGYIALNRGEFDTAATMLSQALEEQAGNVSYVHLELATAYMNLGDGETALTLLEQFIEIFPHSIRAYELLCDILWEKQAFDRANELLVSCPDELKTSVPINLLMGETLYLSGKHEEAVSFYQNSIKYMGWNEPIATALARTYESMGSADEAKAAYKEILNACRGCRRRASTFVKQRYADLSFDAGDVSSALLEMYHDLCQEDPENQAGYYHKISDIYARQGHHEEARRYRHFADERD